MGRLLSDELVLPDLPVRASHPMDSSRILLGLMKLARHTAGDGDSGEALGGVISKGVLRSLLSALHYRDVSTVRHCRRVARVAVGVAQHLSWDEPQQRMIEVAGLLHDIGKIGVPDNILFKPGKLSPDEAGLMALHHDISIDVLQACRVHREVLDVIAQAHSHYDSDGEGYRRAGTSIHQGARILAVADAYDSLRTEQVYREGKSHEAAMKILIDAAGTQFDGNIVMALSRWSEAQGLAFVGESAEFAGSPGPSPGTGHSNEALEASALGQIFAYLYLLESLYDGFFLVDSDLRFVVWNRGVERLLGRPAHQLLGQVWTSRVLGYADRNDRALAETDCPMHRVIAGGKADTSTMKVQRNDGRWIDIELQTVPLLDEQGRLQGVAEIFRDLTRSTRRPQEYRELKLAASRDALTSVANRGELETQLAKLIAEFGQRDNADPFSVIFLDVDHFKSLNDSYGHTVGDQVLVDVARLLQQETYSGELVGRYGGEEFVILCPATGIEDAVRRAERLRNGLARAKVGGLRNRPVTASFGVTQVEEGDSIESVLRRADKALYMAKESGRNKTCSLTGTEAQAGASNAPRDCGSQDDPFVFTNTFHACIAGDMIVYKLGGFVGDQKARLVEVTQQHAILRVGSRGLLPFWGGSDDRRPVEITVHFGDDVEPAVGRRAPSRQVQVRARIRPIGWVRDRSVFRNRASAVMKLLRSYFVAE